MQDYICVQYIQDLNKFAPGSIVAPAKDTAQLCPIN